MIENKDSHRFAEEAKKSFIEIREIAWGAEGDNANSRPQGSPCGTTSYGTQEKVGH